MSPRKGLFSGAPAAGDGASSPSAHLTLGKPFLRGFPGVKSCDRSRGSWVMLWGFCQKQELAPDVGRPKVQLPLPGKLACLSAVSGRGQINLKQE